MKTKKLLIALMLITLIPMTSLFAQRTAGSYAIGGFVGTGMPMSPDFFKDYWTSGGIGFGGEFVYNFTENIGLGVRFHRLPFPANTDELEDLFLTLMQAPPGTTIELDGMAINTNIISANILAFLMPPDPLGIYLTGGGSYYQFSVSDLEYTAEYNGQTISGTEEMDDDIDDKFGINVGGGLEFTAGGSMNIFVEGRYHYLFEEEEGPDFEGGGTSDGSLSFISIVAGIRFSL